MVVIPGSHFAGYVYLLLPGKMSVDENPFFIDLHKSFDIVRNTRHEILDLRSGEKSRNVKIHENRVIHGLFPHAIAVVDALPVIGDELLGKARFSGNFLADVCEDGIHIPADGERHDTYHGVFGKKAGTALFRGSRLTWNDCEKKSEAEDGKKKNHMGQSSKKISHVCMQPPLVMC